MHRMLSLIGSSPRRAASAAAVGLLAVFGCGQSPDGPAVYPVRGTVTLDGAPLPSGTILLQDPARAEKNYVAVVKDGEITGESTPGQKMLVVTAVRQAAGKTEVGADGTGTDPVMEQYLPEKYNLKSQLSANIEPQNDNVITLDLTSK